MRAPAGTPLASLLVRCFTIVYTFFFLFSVKADEHCERISLQGYGLALGNQRFPVRVRLLAVCSNHSANV